MCRKNKPNQSGHETKRFLFLNMPTMHSSVFCFQTENVFISIKTCFYAGYFFLLRKGVDCADGNVKFYNFSIYLVCMEIFSIL